MIASHTWFQLIALLKVLKFDRVTVSSMYICIEQNISQQFLLRDE